MKPTLNQALGALLRLWHEFGFEEYCQMVDNLDHDTPNWRNPSRDQIVTDDVEKTRRKLLAVSVARDVLRAAGQK